MKAVIYIGKLLLIIAMSVAGITLTRALDLDLSVAAYSLAIYATCLDWLRSKQ